MNKPFTAILLAAFALTASVAPAQATSVAPTIQTTDQEPVTFDPSLNVPASDGSLVPPSELAEYEAWLAAGNEAPVAYEEPVEVEPQPGDPVIYGPETVYVEASDGSLVPEAELASYEAWLAEGNEAPTVFGPDTIYVTASDGSLVPESELANYEAWLAEGNKAPEAYPEPQPAPAATCGG